MRGPDINTEINNLSGPISSDDQIKVPTTPMIPNNQFSQPHHANMIQNHQYLFLTLKLLIQHIDIFLHYIILLLLYHH